MNQTYILRRDGCDYQAPDLHTMRTWARDGRVLPSDMVFSPKYQSWYRARDLRELHDVLPRVDEDSRPVQPASSASTAAAIPGIGASSPGHAAASAAALGASGIGATSTDTAARSSTQQFWLRKGEKNYAADSLQTILRWAAEGNISPDDYIYHPSYNKWFRAGDSPQLASRFPKAGAPLADAGVLVTAPDARSLAVAARTDGTGHEAGARTTGSRAGAHPVEDADSVQKTVMDFSAGEVLRALEARRNAQAAEGPQPAGEASTDAQRAARRVSVDEVARATRATPERGLAAEAPRPTAGAAPGAPAASRPATPGAGFGREPSLGGGVRSPADINALAAGRPFPKLPVTGSRAAVIVDPETGAVVQARVGASSAARVTGDDRRPLEARPEVKPDPKPDLKPEPRGESSALGPLAPTPVVATAGSLAGAAAVKPATPVQGAQPVKPATPVQGAQPVKPATPVQGAQPVRPTPGRPVTPVRGEPSEPAAARPRPVPVPAMPQVPAAVAVAPALPVAPSPPELAASVASMPVVPVSVPAMPVVPARRGPEAAASAPVGGGRSALDDAPLAEGLADGSRPLEDVGTGVDQGLAVPPPAAESDDDLTIRYADRLGLMKVFYDIARVFVVTRDLRPGERQETACKIASTGDDLFGQEKRAIYHLLGRRMAEHLEGPVRAAESALEDVERPGHALFVERAEALVSSVRDADAVIGQKPPERFVIGNSGRAKMAPAEEAAIARIDAAFKGLISIRAR